MITSDRGRGIVNIRILVTFGILSIGFLAVLTFAFIYYSHYRSIECPRNFSREAFKYQRLQLDPESKARTFGYMTVPLEVDFGEDGFQFYVDGYGDHILTSNLGDEEYHCSGSCYCSESVRKNAPSVLKRGLNYLSVAITSVVAFNLATEYFKEECVERFTDECDPGSIISDVDDCERVGVRERVETVLDDNLADLYIEYQEEVFTTAHTQLTGSQAFLCSGSCLTSPEAPKTDLDCSTLGLTNHRVMIWETEWSLKQDMLKLGLARFATGTLTIFCDEVRRKIDEGIKAYKRPIHCRGLDDNGQNPSISCRKEKPGEYNIDDHTV